MSEEQRSRARREQPGSPTAERILDVAERLVQRRGFNGFSYADISAELGVTKASLHYHFRSKAELGEVLIERYTERFAAGLDAIDASEDDPGVKLAAYIELYARVLRDDRMCLCGMLAAGYETLPDAMRAAVARFFDLNERWLAGLLEQGRAGGSLRFIGTAGEAAQAIVSMLEGAMLVARSHGDPRRFEAAAGHILAGFADDVEPAHPEPAGAALHRSRI
jgi:TetR/AcrR family transcriptional repressor of nem operon